MPTIKPISPIKIKQNNITKRIKPETLKYVPNSAITSLPLATFGIILSGFLKDYNSTVENENYFQLKHDKKTGKPFKPDVFQNAAGMNLYLGNDVLVTAPTGTGKTAIAEYVITKNLKEGKKTFYTTPLKALSNEKFLDFSKIYGEENVGLLTGDTKINADAPIVIMTTEVYRNMAASQSLNFSNSNEHGIPDNVKTVIFDELQYLGDSDRGGIWEQSLMFTPKDIQILSLSATIGNNEEINNWIASIKNNKSIAVTPDKNYIPIEKKAKETVLINVPSENRHVPLHFEIIHAAPEIGIPKSGTKSERIKARKEGARKAQTLSAKPREDVYKTLTKELKNSNKLPAIYFVFSKKECRHLLKFLSNEAEILTNEDEQKEIENVINRYKENEVYLGENLNYDALKKGYAIHNAGLIPAQKRLIEELFQKKLVKVVLATETLSAGINMPAKTTVISSPRKPTSTPDEFNDGKRSLDSNEYHQMAGRAGRRGIDTEGFCYSISCNPEQTDFYKNLAISKSNELSSSMELDFSFIANYLSEFNDEDELRYMMSKSFLGYKNPEKIDDLIDNYFEKRRILEEENFLNSNGKLTNKGHLLKHINGYEQIPIINYITNQNLAKLDPIQTVGVIAGLANIEVSQKGALPNKLAEFKNITDNSMINAIKLADSYIKDYNETTDNLYPERELNLSTKVINHVYNWALLNSENDNPEECWKELCKTNISNREEGTVYKEISMTIDLLKQLVEICNEGSFRADTEEDKTYYSILRDNFEDAIDLIQRGPLEEENI